ncbi:MAG: abortive infection family protein [Rhodopseudomonas sp.]|uniref:abortive infection family protein n=1 Tax=Rhodopseudomonas sp. TaxID=1078 RepID=UPI0017D56928|nr:abortive infection family protein [Rhodopseudomonas sp.]NVN88785.1 abortive infection family protein [Rhodopseudomonas sp.]
MFDDIPDTSLEQARMLENILLAACEGDRSQTGMYMQLRGVLMGDETLKALLPQFVRTSRDLNHFWSYAKDLPTGSSGHWEKRRRHVRDGLTPVLDFLENRNTAPVDSVASDVLKSFDPDGVHAVWSRALERRHADPEGAITSARTLLETVCKHILDETGGSYTDNDDLPGLYRAVALKLNIAPSQHAEEAFKRILGGATSVVEGLGSLRNKIGDAHGKGKAAVRPAPRHAQLAVNLAGAMATFLIETWQDLASVKP